MENNNNKKTPQPWRLPSNSRCFAECSEYKIKRAGKQQEGKKKTLQLDDCQVTGDILQSIRNMKMGCDNFVWFVCPGRHDSHPLSLFSTSATSRQEMGVPCRLKKKKKNILHQSVPSRHFIGRIFYPPTYTTNAWGEITGQREERSALELSLASFSARLFFFSLDISLLWSQKTPDLLLAGFAWGLPGCEDVRPSEDTALTLAFSRRLWLRDLSIFGWWQCPLRFILSKSMSLT